MSTLLNTVWLLHYSIFNPHLVEIHYFLFVHLFCCLFCIDHCNKSNAMKQVAILCSSEINTKYELEWLIVVCRYFLHYANTHIYHRNSMYMLSGAPNFLLQLYVFVWSVYLQLSVRHFCTLLYLSWGCFVTWGHTCICYIWYISLVYCCIFCTLHPSTRHLFDCCINYDRYNVKPISIL